MVHSKAAALLVAAFAVSPAIGAWSVDLSQVDLGTRIAWCQDQIKSCTTICGFNLDTVNGCDHQSLSYSCRCQSGVAPDMQNYTLTVETHLCEKSYQLCYNAAADESGRKKCADDIKSQCATRPPTQLDVDVASSSPTSFIASTSWLSPTVLVTQSTFQPTSTTDPNAAAEEVASKATLGPLIAGVVIGGLVFIMGVAGLFYWLGSRRQRRSSKDKPRQPADPSGPPHPEASEISILSNPFTDPTAVDKVHSPGPSSIQYAVDRDLQEASDSHKTLIFEKVNGHEMVRDLSGASPLDDDMYFDTAKYRMPPSTKDP